MSEKIINKIDLVESLDDLKKFIEYKKNVKEKISFDEFYELYKIMDKNSSYNRGLNFYLNRNTVFEIVKLLPDDIDDLFRFFRGSCYYLDDMRKFKNGRFIPYSSEKKLDFIKKRIKDDPKNGIKLLVCLNSNVMYLELKYSDFINAIDFSVENNWLDYLPLFSHNEEALDKNMMDKIFSHYSKNTLSHNVLDWIFRVAKNGAISKDLVTRIFSSRIGPSTEFKNTKVINKCENNFCDVLIKRIKRGKYDFYDFCRFIIKFEDSAIDYEIANRIFTETNFLEKYMSSMFKNSTFKISKVFYTKILSVFDSETQKLIENKIKPYVHVFEFNVEAIAKLETWSEFGQLFKTQFQDLFMEGENWLKVFSLAPDFGDYLSCTCPCPYIVYRKYMGSLTELYMYEFVSNHNALIEEKLNVAELKKRVLCGAGIRVCGLLLSFIPDKIDHVFLYWLSFLYERTTVTSWGSHVCTSATGYEDGEHITANRRTANFYANRFSGAMNQYSLCRFIKIFKDGSITKSSAEKFLKDLRFINGEQIEFGDQNYNKILSKFTDAGKKVFEKYFLIAESLFSQNHIC